MTTTNLLTPDTAAPMLGKSRLVVAACRDHRAIVGILTSNQVDYAPSRAELGATKPTFSVDADLHNVRQHLAGT